MKLILPPWRGPAALAAALELEPVEKRFFVHIATFTAEEKNLLRACAAANVARWILSRVRP